MNAPNSPKRQTRSGPRPGARESKETLETFAQRTKRPGDVGLANESRPGIGTRARAPGNDPEVARGLEIDVTDVAGVQSVLPPPAPERDPEEQDSRSLAQELQRDTGVSGQSGGV